MILLVDDDPRFLQHAEIALHPLNDVIMAATAEQAINLAEALQDDISLALIDLNLPGMNGFDLIDKLHREFPTLPIIAMSGVLQKHALESAKLLGAAEVLSKPITREWRTTVERVRGSANLH